MTYSPSTRRPHRGFGLLDLLVVLLLWFFLLALLVPTIAHSRGEGAGRVKCASNLRQIGMGMTLYASENGRRLPRTTWDPNFHGINAYTGSAAKDPFGLGGPKPNDVTAAMFLLIRTQELIPSVFVCPETARQGWDFGGHGRGAADCSNFPSEAFLGYSLANPYPASEDPAKGYAWTDHFQADFAMVAEMNPGGAGLVSLGKDAPAREMAVGNSMNNRGLGQYVLFGDGHVEFSPTPFCGRRQDNIYTFGGLTPGDQDGVWTPRSLGVTGPPVDESDSVLLPAATEKPPTRMTSDEEAAILRSIGAGGLSVGIVLALWRLHAARRRRAQRARPVPGP